jgi:hypothetical protein
MKSILKSGPLSSRSMAMTMAIIIMAFSCTKSNDTTTGNNAAKYCGTIAWSNPDQSGTFTGSSATGSYRLTDATHTENGIKGEFQLQYDSNGHLINDPTGVNFTYNADTLTKIVITNSVTSGNGNGEYDFDSKGHFTGGVMNFTSLGSEGTVIGTWSYDSNDDPVNFHASGTLNSSNGPINITMTITGDFLTDKTSFLPFLPIFAPMSTYFSLIPFISKHLLNKWIVSITATGITPINYTVQYTYTYDSNGNIATMVNTGNSSNIYTFTYSNCK